MFRKILIPLDGSERSQAVVTHISGLITAMDSQLHLLAVVPPPDLRAADDVALMAEARQQAERYLHEVKARLSDKGLRATSEVRLGHPVEQIVTGAREGECDLIAMSSHGYSGLRRLAYGSVAERVLRTSQTPVLLVKSYSSWDDAANPAALPLSPLDWHRVVVPLDGSANAELALAAAVPLARLTGARLTLVRAAPLAIQGGFYGMHAAAAANVPSLEPERKYLNTLAERLRASEVEVDVVVAYGAPAVVLADYIQSNEPGGVDTKVDLIVMTTHGRSGVQRWLLGSVAESLLRELHTPILALRVPDETS